MLELPEVITLSKQVNNALSGKYTEAEFEKLVAEAKKTLSAKALLATNQRIPGVGNGVTQDILFNARINPKQKVLLLSDNQKDVLFNALKETLVDMTFEGEHDMNIFFSSYFVRTKGVFYKARPL